MRLTAYSHSIVGALQGFFLGVQINAKNLHLNYLFVLHFFFCRQVNLLSGYMCRFNLLDEQSNCVGKCSPLTFNHLTVIYLHVTWQFAFSKFSDREHRQQCGNNPAANPCHGVLHKIQSSSCGNQILCSLGIDD